MKKVGGLEIYEAAGLTDSRSWMRRRLDRVLNRSRFAEAVIIENRLYLSPRLYGETACTADTLIVPQEVTKLVGRSKLQNVVDGKLDENGA